MTFKGYYLNLLPSRTPINILFSTSLKIKNSFSALCFDKFVWIKSYCLAFERMLLAVKMPQTFLVMTKNYRISRRKNYRQKSVFYSFEYLYDIYVVAGTKVGNHK